MYWIGSTECCFPLLLKKKNLTAFCKKGDYISSLSSSELLSSKPHTGLNSSVIGPQGFLGFPSDIHPTGEHCLKLASPSDVNSRSPWCWVSLIPQPHPQIQPTWHIVSTSSLMNWISSPSFSKWKVLLWTTYRIFKVFYLFIYFSYLSTQPGARAHGLEIKSHMFFRLSQPGVPHVLYI